MSRPLLLLDLNGPLDPFLSWSALDEGYQPVGVEYSTWFLHQKHGQWLMRLSEHVDIMWASTWEETANDVACAFYGLPHFEYITFGEGSMSTGLPFKLREVQKASQGRSLIWIEDEIDDEMRDWTTHRDEPTLLIVPDARHGWTEEQYQECLAFLGQTE